jgi:uncharacterized membrane protein YbhN (UPF0104 family)
MPDDLSPSPAETSSTDDAAPAKRTSPRARLVTGLKYFFGAVAIALLVYGVASQWDGIVAALHRLDAATLVIACLFTLIALTANMLSWKSMMSALGTPVPLGAASAVFFVGQLGKYIPGGVWSIAAQAELGRAYGLRRGPSAMTAITSMLVGMVTAAVVGITGLVLSASDGLQLYWWLALLALAGIVSLSPPVLSRLVGVVLRLLRRPASPITPTWTGTALSFAWSITMWLAYAVQATVILHAFGARSPSLFVVSMGAYAVAWLVGFLVIIAPAGLGAREGVLVVLLAAVTTRDLALGLAVLSRAIQTLGDVLLAGFGASLAAGHRRARRQRTRADVAAGDATNLPATTRRD